MAVPKKYASWAEFERVEFLRVKSFYQNLQEIIDEGFFANEDDLYENENGETKELFKNFDL